ncbi:putative acetolactate synthase large subunit [Nocardia brasiliensis NBRC 14402]|uniref:thiamine pyrophosphate-binding protein n=1 Tax=Nocardia brasiliensis TaxID=37326 RepID=UPI0002D37819|nr:thiamine pyrophosphate-binding protein [Nocardia brasiliensis]ASF08016.1 thiamine pyrophosphate-binding protein [Nocardia brasiliensis]GAJ80873.1 putative acetolactate synthase large subunit [Nocardia brasiliensis NBRC 14402]SUB54352.1 Acetolactate synthase large subunit [Nocardia brasiliensis]
MNRTRSISETNGVAVECRKTVADRIIELIAAHTDHVFGVGGANIEDVYDALHRSAAPLTGVVAKHEFGAATMADGYARTTNRLGIVVATSGGGALNLVAALGESFDSRIPVLALVGQPPRPLEGHGAFQDTGGGHGRIDAERLFGTVARVCLRLDRAEDVTEVVTRAIEAARAGGPAVLLLPKDVQAQQAPDEEAWPIDPGPRPLDLVGGEPSGNGARRGKGGVQLDGALDSEPKGDCREGAAQRGQARRVDGAVRAGVWRTVIIAGPEVARADARGELLAAAVALGAAVAVTPDAKDVFPNGHAHFAGIAGSMGHPRVAELLAAAELCVVVGTPLPVLARAGLEAALTACPRIWHIGTDRAFVRTAAWLCGPLRTRLAELTASAAVDAVLREPIVPAPLEVPHASGPGVRYRDALDAIAARLTPGTDVVVDAGNTGAAAVHHLPVPPGGRFVIALGMGGMGYAFGAGIGSALGRRRRTFVLAGDGAYFMHGHEVHTAVEYHAPVTFVIFNNNAHAMCVTREQLYYSGDYTYNRFGPARIGAAVAAMFPHLPAYSADTRAEFEAALHATATETGPVFLEIRCDPDEIPPFAPFLKELYA